MTAAGTAHDDTGTEEPPAGRRRRVPPPTRRQFVVLMVALLYLAGSVGYILGSRPPGHPGRESVDVGFLYDMVAHHRQAVTMATLELERGAERNVLAIAGEILTSQSYEVGIMEQQLANWDHPRDNLRLVAMEWMGMPVEVDEMPGLASEAELAALDDAQGRDADALFVALMKDHHRGGVHMAEYAATHAKWDFVRDLAARMARNQQIEINELEQVRVRDGLPADPAGYVPEVLSEPR